MVLDYGMIFGRLGLPELGAVGSAWATFIARGVGLALLLVVLWRGRNGVNIRGADGWWPKWLTARRILTLGVPAALEQLLITSAFLMQTVVIAQLGTVVLAAQRVAMNAMSLSFLPGFGFAMAATTLVGQSIGARRPDEGRIAAHIATRWAVVWMSVLGVVFFFFAEMIMRFFSEDPTVISIGADGLRIVAFTQPFWAIGFVQAGSLRGTGDTRFPLFVNTAIMWLAIGLGALFVTLFGGNLAAVWSAFMLTSPVSAWLMWRHFHRTIDARVEPVVERS